MINLKQLAEKENSKVADLKETKTCTGPESDDRVAADGSEEYSKKILIQIIWQSADDSIADESEGEKVWIVSKF